MTTELSCAMPWREQGEPGQRDINRAFNIYVLRSLPMILVCYRGGVCLAIQPGQALGRLIRPLLD